MSYLTFSELPHLSTPISGSEIIPAVSTANSSLTNVYVTPNDFLSFISSSRSLIIATASYALTGGGGTSSYIANTAFTSSYLTTSSYHADSSSLVGILVGQGAQISALEAWSSSAATVSSLNNFTTSYATDSASFSASISRLNSGTSSFVTNSQTSSFVVNSQITSFVTNSQTSSMTVLSASYATTASYALNGGNATINTSSFVTNNQTSSFVTNSQTSSMTVLSASAATYALTASYALNGNATINTASFVTNSETASMSVLTSSYANTATTASYVENAVSTSYATVAANVLGSITSASYAATASSLSITNLPSPSTVGDSDLTILNQTGSAVQLSLLTLKNYVLSGPITGTIQIRANTSASIASTLLAVGEPAVTTDTGYFYIGNGISNGGNFFASSQWKVISGSYTVQNGDRLQVVTTGSAVTVMGPVSASVGQFFQAEDGAASWSSNNFTFNPNGLNVNGGGSNVVFSTNNQKLSGVYVSTAYGWSVK